MSNDGAEMKRIQVELDVSITEIALAADVHPQTVYKVFANQGASRNSVNRVRKALSALQERSKSAKRVAS